MDSEIGSIQPNPYLFNIENRKRRKARLAHEIGAGALCLKCKESCPGFELHFWRKICQNCRCSKDDHDVQEDDEDIGKVVIGKLFERPIRTKEDEQKYSYGTDLEIVNESTGRKEKLKFDWIPPGVASNIAKRYMEMLPPEKRPVAGSEAAKERKRQLEQQCPLYDMDESERCENLLPEEHNNFQKYLTVLRTSVAGQASVQEIGHTLPMLHHSQLPISSKNDDLQSQVNATNYGDFNLQSVDNLETKISSDRPYYEARDNENIHSENFLNNNLTNSGEKHVYFDTPINQQFAVSNIANAMDGLGLEIKNDGPNKKSASRNMETSFPYQPSCFVSHSQPLEALPIGYQTKNLQTHYDKFPVTELKSSPADQIEIPQNMNKQYDSGIKNLSGPKPYIAKSIEQSLIPGQYSSTLGKGSYKLLEGEQAPLPYETHSLVGPQELISQSKIVNYQKPYGNDTNITKRPLCDYKTEISSGLQYDLDNQNHSLRKPLPQMLAKDGQVISSYAMQAPYMAQRDTIIGSGMYAESNDVHVLFPNESQVLGKESKKRTEVSLPEMTLFFCQYCQDTMKSGDVAVICERAGPDKYWHPQCFVCVTCKELLADLIYFYKDGQIFCGRHYTQAADIPRCKACDELIFTETWTRADGFDWHIQHYCCFMCDNPLAGMKYVPDEKGFPHCMSCYMTFKAKMCETCEDKIPPSETRAGFRGYFYHAKPSCFCCYACREPMIGKKFKMVKNWIFCSQDCINSSQTAIMENPSPMEKLI